MGSFTKYTALAEALDLQSITENFVIDSLSNHNEEISLDIEQLRNSNVTNAEVLEKLHHDVLSISSTKTSAKNTIRDLKKYKDSMIQLYESNGRNKKATQEKFVETASHYRNKIKEVTDALQRTPLAQHSLLLQNEIKLTEFRIKEYQRETERSEKAYRRREEFRWMRERAIIVQIAHCIIELKRKAGTLKEIKAETARLRREITVERLQNVNKDRGAPRMAPLEVFVESDDPKLPSPPKLTPFFDVLTVLNEDTSQSAIVNTAFNSDEGMEPPIKLSKRAASARQNNDISLRKKCLTSFVPNLSSERHTKKARFADELEVDTVADVAESSRSGREPSNQIEVLNEINICDSIAMKWVADIELGKLQKVDQIDALQRRNENHIVTKKITSEDDEEKLRSSQAEPACVLVPPTQFQDLAVASQQAEQEEIDMETDELAPVKNLTNDTPISSFRLDDTLNVSADLQHHIEPVKLHATPEFTYDKIDTTGSVVSKFFSNDKHGKIELESQASQKKEQPAEGVARSSNIQSSTPAANGSAKDSNVCQEVIKGSAPSTDTRLEYDDDTDDSCYDFTGLIDAHSLLLSPRAGEEHMEIVNEAVAPFGAENPAFNLVQNTETADKERTEDNSENVFRFNFQQDKKKGGFFSLFG